MFVSFGQRLRGLGNMRIGFRAKGSTGCLLVCFYYCINAMLYVTWYTLLATLWLGYGMCYFCFYLPIKWVINMVKKKNEETTSYTTDSKPSEEN